MNFDFDFDPKSLMVLKWVSVLPLRCRREFQPFLAWSQIEDDKLCNKKCFVQDFNPATPPLS